MQTQEDELKNALNGSCVETEPSENDEENAPFAEDAAQTEAPAQDNADKPLTVEELQSENMMLREQLEKAAAEHKADHEQMVRALAEAMNMKKRAEADVERERKFGNEKIIKSLLPVVDSLDLAIEHTDHANPLLKPTIEGLENTMSLFLKELKNFGVDQLNPIGQAFDPNLHQAISMVPSSDVEPNHILSVMQKGFVLNGRVVRPAMVIVAKAPENAPKDGDDEHRMINIEA